MSIEELKQMSLKDLLDIDASRLTSEEVAYVEKRLVKEANRRLRRLKQAKKLTSAKLTKKERKGFTSFKTPKGYKPKTAGSNKLVSKTSRKKKPIDVRNKRAKNVTEVQSFLKKKTSKIKGINKQDENYRKVISKTMGREINLTDRQLRRVSRLMEKAKELLGITDEQHKKLSGSPVQNVLATVIDIVKSRKYIKVDDALDLIDVTIHEGYEKTQRIINDLNEEDADGLDIDYDDVYNG